MIILMMLSFVVSEDFITYPEAHAKFEKTKRPVAIIVTTKTCPHCVTMKKTLRQMKEDYPEFILCEIPAAQAALQFDFIDNKRGVPQTFAYVYDNEDLITRRLPVILGSVSKEAIYKAWGMK